MTHRYLIAGLVALTTFSFGVPFQALGEAPPALGWTTRAVVVDCQDGDTVTVDVTTRMRVRLIDCWAAELPTEDGKAAKRYIEAMTLGKPAVLFIPHGKKQLGDSTNMGRVLGKMWVEPYDEDVSELMVQMGYATPSKTERNKKWPSSVK